MGTETDFTVNETEQNVVSAHTETNIMGTRKGRPGNGRKQVYVCGGSM